MRIIPDLGTAIRIGEREVRAGARSFKPFQYEDRPSRLTLYGVEIMDRFGAVREIRKMA